MREVQKCDAAGNLISLKGKELEPELHLVRCCHCEDFWENHAINDTSTGVFIKHLTRYHKSLPTSEILEASALQHEVKTSYILLPNGKRRHIESGDSSAWSKLTANMHQSKRQKKPRQFTKLLSSMRLFSF